MAEIFCTFWYSLYSFPFYSWHQWITFLNCAYSDKCLVTWHKIFFSCHTCFAFSDVLLRSFPIYFSYWWVAFFNCTYNEKSVWLLDAQNRSIMLEMLLHFLMFCCMFSLFISHTDLLHFLIANTMTSVWLLDKQNAFIMPEMFCTFWCSATCFPYLFLTLLDHIFLIVETMISVWLNTTLLFFVIFCIHMLCLCTQSMYAFIGLVFFICLITICVCFQ